MGRVKLIEIENEFGEKNLRNLNEQKENID